MPCVHSDQIYSPLGTKLSCLLFIGDIDHLDMLCFAAYSCKDEPTFAHDVN